MKKNIFVALDFSNFDKALDVASSVKDHAAGLKITNELFTNLVLQISLFLIPTLFATVLSQAVNILIGYFLYGKKVSYS